MRANFSILVQLDCTPVTAECIPILADLERCGAFMQLMSHGASLETRKSTLPKPIYLIYDACVLACTF